MEDDPYYYLQFKPGQPPQGLNDLGASYLSMDTENRVLRLDSFSKVKPSAALLALLGIFVPSERCVACLLEDMLMLHTSRRRH